jgi:hypothetical protein
MSISIIPTQHATCCDDIEHARNDKLGNSTQRDEKKSSKDMS